MKITNNETPHYEMFSILLLHSLSANTPLSTLFSDTLNVFFLTVGDDVLQPYKTTGTIIWSPT
jgi:hypothetical protein